MKKTTLIAGAAVIVVAAAIIFRLTAKKEEAVYESRPTVAVQTPQKGDITLYTDLTGTIEPESRASVTPKMGGEVLAVNFSAGDKVEKGQTLITIDSDALTALKLQMDSAKVQADEASRSLSRTQPLYESGYVSQQAWEQTQDAATAARLAYETAKNQYDLQLKYTTVTAPISGIIESRDVDAHDHISTDNAICVISGEGAMQVTFGVTDKIRRNMNLGDEIMVEKNGESYQAFVTETGSMVNASTGLYDAKAELPVSEGLTNGMRVKLTVIMDKAEDAMVIPVDAVNYDNGQPFVYILTDGENGAKIAKKTNITAGIYDSDRMAVEGGLAASDQVVTSWSNELVDGAEVLLDAGADGGSQTEGTTAEAQPQKAGE